MAFLTAKGGARASRPPSWSAAPTLCIVAGMKTRPLGAVRAIFLGLALVLMPMGAADAQLFGWFSNLFGGGGGRPAATRDEGARPTPRRHTPRRKPSDTTAQEPSNKAAAQQKATLFVDVFGDTFGQLLANGLDDALSDRPDIGVIHLGRGASGLANKGYYDWPKTVDELLARDNRAAEKKKDEAKKEDAKKDEKKNEKKDEAKRDDKKDEAGKERRIDVAVMMIGSNDRQPIIENGKRLDTGTPEWTEAYRARVLAVAQAFQSHKIPLIWVGLPIVKNDEMADDMAALNDIYREVAARTGATYIDTWEAFADEDGDFVANGPDVTGQTTRLRTSDGIYFTKAGARKLAHFVEGQVRHLLDGRAPAPQLPTGEGSAATKSGVASVAAPKPEAGPIKALSETPVAKDGRLVDLNQVKTESAHDPVVVNALVKGHAEPAPAGRADDFRWPQDNKPGAN